MRDLRTGLARFSGAASVAILLLAAATARGQGPQFDVGSPPGAAGGSSAVGQPLGAANFPDFGSPSNAPFSRPGGSMGSPRAGERVDDTGRSRVHRAWEPRQTIKQNAPPLEIPQIGEGLELEVGHCELPAQRGRMYESRCRDRTARRARTSICWRPSSKCRWRKRTCLPRTSAPIRSFMPTRSSFRTATFRS